MSAIDDAINATEQEPIPTVNIRMTPNGLQVEIIDCPSVILAGMSKVLEWTAARMFATEQMPQKQPRTGLVRATGGGDLRRND